MIRVNFIAADGTKTVVEGQAGTSVMQTAVGNGIDGIVGDCGGSMSCATCHCYVDEAWTDRTGPRQDGEDDMLEGAASEVRPTSRLSCQITLDETMDGLTIHTPEAQF